MRKKTLEQFDKECAEVFAINPMDMECLPCNVRILRHRTAILALALHGAVDRGTDWISSEALASYAFETGMIAEGLDMLLHQ